MSLIHFYLFDVFENLTSHISLIKSDFAEVEFLHAERVYEGR